MTAAIENTQQEIYQGLKSFRGAITELALRCNCTREWVRLVLKGKYPDDNLLKQAAVLLLEKTTTKVADQNLIHQKITEVREAQS